MCWHKWTKWRDVRQTNDGDLIQEKRCTKCNMAKRRSESPLWDDGTGDEILP